LVSMLFFAGCADKPVEPDLKPPFEGEVTIQTDVGYDITGYLSIPDGGNNAKGEREIREDEEWLRVQNIGKEDSDYALFAIDFKGGADFDRFFKFGLLSEGKDGGEKLRIVFIDFRGNDAFREFELSEVPEPIIIELHESFTEIELKNIKQIVFQLGNSVGNPPGSIIYIKDDISVWASIPILTGATLAPNTFQEILQAADVVQKTILASETVISASVGRSRLRRMPLSSRRTRTYTTNDLICQQKSSAS